MFLYIAILTVHYEVKYTEYQQYVHKNLTTCYKLKTF